MARPPAAGTEADPVLLEVINNLFMSVADQMGATLANTAWSVNIKERLGFFLRDLRCGGRSGGQCAACAGASGVDVACGEDGDRGGGGARRSEGDAWMLNCPWNGGTHLPDVTVITPVFVGGRLAFWLGSRGHHADIGGRTPGSAPPDSTDDRGRGRGDRPVPAGRARAGCARRRRGRLLASAAAGPAGRRTRTWPT